MRVPSSTGGVELRESSIRVIFWYCNRRVKETLYLDDAPLPPTPANVRYARRLAAEVTAAIKVGTFCYAEYFPRSSKASGVKLVAPGLFDTMDRWVALHDVKASTKKQYTARLSCFWKVVMKDVPIDQVRYSDILEALNKGTWKSGKSRNNELSMIKGVFEFARRDKLITTNPCEEIGRAEYQRKAPDPFDMTEVNQLLSYLEQSRPQPVLNFVQTMFFTGLRTSEGLALRWGNIDFKKKEMMIEGGNVYDEESDTTKTFQARCVKLTSRGLEALERQKLHTFLQGDHVFHDPATGKPWAYNKITDVRSFWKISLKKLGIRYRRPYNMRHTYATIGLMSGARPAFLASQLGHGLRMFFDVYAKWINTSDDAREMEKLEAAISLSVPEVSPAAKSRST